MPSAPRPIAIITGASTVRGIGAAIAEYLAAAGWDLFLTGHEEPEPAGLAAVAEHVAAAAPDARIDTLAADLADDGAPRRVIDRCLDLLGTPTALINNAAVSRRGTLAETGPADLDDHWRVNARAPILLTAAFARVFDGDAGAVVNLTSGQGLGAMPGELAYAVSKGALEAFTVQAAAELAPRRIRVNAVDPGPTDTGWMREEDRAALTTPFGRVGEPTDAARLVAWLCSDDARWITGQILRSRGGL